MAATCYFLVWTAVKLRQERADRYRRTAFCNNSLSWAPVLPQIRKVGEIRSHLEAFYAMLYYSSVLISRYCKFRDGSSLERLLIFANFAIPRTGSISQASSSAFRRVRDRCRRFQSSRERAPSESDSHSRQCLLFGLFSSFSNTFSEVLRSQQDEHSISPVGEPMDCTRLVV